MPIIFQSRPGQVVQLDDPAIQCTSKLGFGFKETSEDITFGQQRSIVTRVMLSHQVNLQFLHTLGQQIFIYVFGDRMGTINLSGLAFPCVCDGDEMGAEQMLLWYKSNRASVRSNPLRVVVGRQVIEGFVTSFTEDVVDPSLNLVQWGVSMSTLPEDN